MSSNNKGRKHRATHEHRTTRLTRSCLTPTDADRTCINCFQPHRRRSDFCSGRCGYEYVRREQQQRPSVSVWVDPARMAPMPFADPARRPGMTEVMAAAFGGWIEDCAATNVIQGRAAV